jgi:hypothetical protein
MSSKFTLAHPGKKNPLHDAVWLRYSSTPTPRTPASTIGIPNEELKEILSKWSDDGSTYCNMDFTLNINEYLPKAVGCDDKRSRYKMKLVSKEVHSNYYKCALEDLETGNIILRSFTFSEEIARNAKYNTQSRYIKTHIPGWSIDLSNITADVSFWSKLKKIYTS